jgi:hypothetical protein
VKVAENVLAGTLTLDATCTAALLLERLIVAPPVGAKPLRVTVPVAVPAPVSVLGLKARELTTTGRAFTVSVTEIA